MKPISFPEQTQVLKKPSSMTDEECTPLPVYNDGKNSISCWRGGFRDRLRFLFTGKMWLWVISGSSQPPVLVTPDYPFPKGKGKA